LFLIVNLVLCLMLGGLSMANAQNGNTKDQTDSLIARLDQIEATLNRETLSDQTYTSLRADLTQIGTEAKALQDKLQPQLQETQARANTLKPADQKDGAEANPETEELAKRRQELQAQLSELDAQIKLVSSTIVRTEQLSNRITVARQQRFTSQLLERSNTILDPTLWVKGLAGLITTWQVTLTLLSDWASYLSTKAADQIWSMLAMLLFVILLIFGPLRILLFVGLSRLASLESPTALQRSYFASWAVLVYTIFPVAILWAITLILSNANLLPGRIELLLDHLSFVVFSGSLSYGLARVLLAPGRPNYRLLKLESGDARKIFSVALALIVTFVIETLVNQVDELLFAPLETTIFLNGAAAVLIAVLVFIGLRLLIAAQPDQSVAPVESEEIQNGFSLPRFIRLLQPLVWLVCLIVGAAPILGFVSLGAFVAEQMGRLFVILGLLGILSALIDNFLLEYLGSTDGPKQRISKAMGVSTSAVNQLGVLLNGIVRVLLYLSAALLIFSPWGVESTDFLSSLKNAIFNVKLGDLTISPVNILGALVVFIIAIVLLKSVERWIEQRWLPATNLDSGLKSSIQTSLGYLGVIIAAMIAFSYMGLDLSNIALVAGALSVGIGFGLQSIVNNFVSGLILLVERPIKTGDWVVVGSDQGYIKKISVRATKIETFDRATVVVPNSELISNRVMNWMHNGSMGRIIVPVGVSYDADPEQVRQILLDVADANGYVTSYPAPVVYFMDFGASSLDFELRCFVQDVNNSMTAKSDLRFAIFKALKDARIEIPFPQQDVHVRSVSVPEELKSTTEESRKKLRKTRSRPKADEVEVEDSASDNSSDGDADAAEN
jgi:small-conductance mechanosensitive channel